MFGLFRLLGYRFSPRIADVGGTGFWRADIPAQLAGDYGPLNSIPRNKVNLERIITHRPDMLRVAGSLVTDQVRAYDLLRMLSRDGYPTPLGQALAEYGRIAKTLHLLAMVDPVDETSPTNRLRDSRRCSLTTRMSRSRRPGASTSG